MMDEEAAASKASKGFGGLKALDTAALKQRFFEHILAGSRLAGSRREVANENEEEKEEKGEGVPADARPATGRRSTLDVSRVSARDSKVIRKLVHTHFDRVLAQHIAHEELEQKRRDEMQRAREVVLLHYCVQRDACRMLTYAVC
jgi:hypothetical protein